MDQTCKLFFGAPRVSRKRDWAILTHGNCRCDYYKQIDFWSKIEKVNIFSSSWIWALGGIPPPGSTVQTSRIHPPGQISQFHPPGLIMTCRVRWVVQGGLHTWFSCKTNRIDINTEPKPYRYDILDLSEERGRQTPTRKLWGLRPLPPLKGRWLVPIYQKDGMLW